MKNPDCTHVKKPDVFISSAYTDSSFYRAASLTGHVPAWRVVGEDTAGDCCRAVPSAGVAEEGGGADPAHFAAAAAAVATRAESVH